MDRGGRLAAMHATCRNMKAIEDLKAEHKLISRVLLVVEEEAERVEHCERPDVEAWRLVLEFSRHFADGCHHRKEEALLFPLLAEKSDVIRDGPVKVLKAEHESGRYFMRELEKAIDEAEAGQEDSARIRAGNALRLYTRMLRRHIEKEEEIVFVLAQVLLSPEQAQELAEGFDSVEAEMGEAHEHYHQVVEELEQRLQASPLR